jgi:menaquinone reductase, multiheme cytochrome c subunit
MTRRAVLLFSAGLALALALGWVGFPHLLYARADQPLRFSHKTHASDKTGFGCADCHPIGEDGRFAGIPRIDNCAGCHAEPQGETAEEKRLVEDYVTPGREIPWLVYSRQPENVRFPHAIHVKRAEIACERCHGAHGASDALPLHETNRITGYSRDLTQMSDCESCHAEHRHERTACLACHK